MTLLHITPYFAPAWAFGGVCRAVSELAFAQARTGHRVTVVTTDALSRQSRLRRGQDEIDGVTVFRVRNALPFARARFNLSTPLGFSRLVRRILAAERVDVIHLHELRTVENLRTIVAPHSAVPPALVLSPHGTLPYATGRGGIKQAWDRLFGARILRKVGLVVALTAAEAADAKALGDRCGSPLHDDEIAIVPNGVDLTIAARLPDRPGARARWTLGDGPVVLFLGRLTERKGPRLLVAAFAEVVRHVPAARLLMAGPDDGARDAVMGDVRRLGLSNHVVLPGMLDQDDRLHAFAASDVFALPAVGEGFPISALESLACGLPVVLSPGCHFPEAADAGCGLTVTCVAAAWAEALTGLLADPARRAGMAVRGRALAARYDWPQIAACMDKAYRNVPRGARE